MCFIGDIRVLVEVVAVIVVVVVVVVVVVMVTVSNVCVMFEIRIAVIIHVSEVL